MENLPPPPICASCGKNHSGVCRKTSGACYGCGSTDHKVKDYPKQNETALANYIKPPPTSGRVYSTTRDQAAKASEFGDSTDALAAPVTT
ncbi:hypothetical protein CTI12_AA427820 [Artemisia annua]|uniref:Uncharacterized protein n=1 Tax=Artemisia annua TaxID=35608 RepID=A0A2U1LGP2_ARTAN|nr:hypothetical protein CTI12_AA427820 [Artemisia annua]